MVTFAREDWVDARGDIESLTGAHYAEMTSFPDIPLDVDWAFYAAVADAGVLRTFTAREKGLLIGYAIFVVRRHPHYQGHVWANNDVIWVHPDHRRGGGGRDFVRFISRSLEDGGADVIHMRTKIKHPELKNLLESLGFFADEIGMSKRLNYGH